MRKVLIGIISLAITASTSSFAKDFGTSPMKNVLHSPITNIYQGNVYLSSQQQINDFGNHGYTAINGNLTISGSDIYSLGPLASIESINNLLIQYTALTDIVGLNSLQNVNGLNINDNFGLINISGMSSLTAINSDCQIYGNGELASLSGFSSVLTIGGLLSISDNSLLTIDGFRALQSINGKCQIENENPYTIFGFNNLTLIGESLEIKNCIMSSASNCFPAITSIADHLTLSECSGQIDSFNNLTNVGSIIIDSNIITTLLGFNALQNVTDLSIVNNPNLGAINAFSNLLHIGGKLDLKTNPLLTTIDGFDHTADIGGEVIIAYNAIDFSNGVFPALSLVGGNLHLDSNSSNTVMDSFNNLLQVNGYLFFSCSSIDIAGFDVLLNIGDDFSFSGGSTKYISGFPNLLSVGGRFTISSTANLESVSGIINLATVTKLVSINHNDALTSLSGFPHLTTIGDEMRINNNLLLPSLNNKFNALLSVPNGILIEMNPVLQQIDDFNLLVNTSGIVIQSNYKLSYLSGFNSVVQINSLRFGTCPLLPTINGFSNLSTITNFLTIQGLSVLVNINGLQNLSNVKNISIYNNANLSSLSHLENIDNIDYISILQNAHLSMCSTSAICAHLSDNGISNIQFNANGCNSSTDILSHCNLAITEFDISDLKLSPNPTEGIIYFDQIVYIKEINVYNNLGQKLGQIQPKNGNVDLSAFDKGLYYLNFITLNKSYFYKILKI